MYVIFLKKDRLYSWWCGFSLKTNVDLEIFKLFYLLRVLFAVIQRKDPHVHSETLMSVFLLFFFHLSFLPPHLMASFDCCFCIPSVSLVFWAGNVSKRGPLQPVAGDLLVNIYFLFIFFHHLSHLYLLPPPYPHPRLSAGSLSMALSLFCLLVQFIH